MAEKRYENKEMQRRFEQSRPKKDGMGMGKMKEKESMDGDEDMDEKPIEDMVKEHGPADHVEVTSHHGKHMHKSMHHDAMAAKEHMDKAFGDGEEGEHMPEDESGMAMGGGIPTMARP
jgi:hypothetical protein